MLLVRVRKESEKVGWFRKDKSPENVDVGVGPLQCLTGDVSPMTTNTYCQRSHFAVDKREF